MGFVRNKENFNCEKCSVAVVGTGYTNHCPNCLWSKHVDVDPGDRAANCGGMMQPISVEGSTPNYVITHECDSCGFKRRNIVQKEDDPAAIVTLATKRT